MNRPYPNILKYAVPPFTSLLRLLKLLQESFALGFHVRCMKMQFSTNAALLKLYLKLEVSVLSSSERLDEQRRWLMLIIELIVRVRLRHTAPAEEHYAFPSTAFSV